MSDRIFALLVEEGRKRTVKRHHLERIDILIRASHQGGGQSNGQIVRDLSFSYNTLIPTLKSSNYVFVSN